MTEEDLNPWFEMVPQNTISKLLDPIVDPLGKGIGGVASFIMNPLMKLGVINKYNMENFERKIMEKNNNIPIEHRDTSKQGLALKAVEDSIYQLDNEELQEMFANLIASSLDDRKNKEVFPSFSTVLKDMTAKDASLFNTIYNVIAVPKVNINFGNHANPNNLLVAEHILLTNDGTISEPVSINTLDRLGLINIRTNALIQPNFRAVYSTFPQNEYYISALRELELLKSADIPFDKLVISEGYITVSEFGKKFGNAVITN